MDQNRFNQFAEQGYNRIPVHREVMSDLDTPLSVYLKLVDAPFAFLFESIAGGEQWGRYSIIGLPCKTVYKVIGKQLVREELGREVERQTVADPLQAIDALRTTFKVPRLPELPLFTGGLVGYFGYETVGYVEPRLAEVSNEDLLGVPDIQLMLS